MRSLTTILMLGVTLSLTRAAAQPPAASQNESPALRVVTLGDSITKGVRPGVRTEETFAARLAAELQRRGVAAHVGNLGIGGERTDQALQRL
jgi:lysophospholipase L1-like esterase